MGLCVPDRNGPTPVFRSVASTPSQCGPDRRNIGVCIIPLEFPRNQNHRAGSSRNVCPHGGGSASSAFQNDADGRTQILVWRRGVGGSRFLCTRSGLRPDSNPADLRACHPRSSEIGFAIRRDIRRCICPNGGRDLARRDLQIVVHQGVPVHGLPGGISQGGLGQ